MELLNSSGSLLNI